MLFRSLLVTAVLGVGVAAVVDTLPEADSPPAGATEAETLRLAGVRGLLTYSDSDCRLHAVRLPSLRPAKAPTIESCEPHVPTGGIGTWKGDVVWAGFGYQTIQVVLSKEDLTRGLARLGWEVTGGYRARQAVSLAGGWYAVHSLPEPNVLAFIRRGRVERIVSGFLGEKVVLRPSPDGSHVAVLDRQRGRIRVFSADGSEIRLPEITNPRAIAWSPDERWTALATRWSVYIFPTRHPEGPVLRIPLRVRDLDWSA